MPMIPVDTAVQLIVGPLIDDTDFKSLETGVAYNAAGMSVDLIKSSISGTPTKTDLTLTTAGSQDWIELGNGMYYVEITAAQNNVEGELQLVGVATGILPFISAKYQVVPQTVFNSLTAGTDTLPVDVTQWLGTAAATPTTAGVPEVDVTFVSGTAQTANDIGADANTIVSELAKVPKSDGTVSWNATALAAINAEADTAISDAALATAANLATVDTVVDNLNLGIIYGATSGVPTTTSTNTDLTGYADSELVGRVIVFTSGTADGQAATITSYTSTSGVVGFAAITTAPAAADTFKIV